MYRILYTLAFFAICFTLPLNARTISVRSLSDLKNSLTKANVTLSIKTDIDLQGQTLEIPEDVKLRINSTISNGAIVGSNTYIKMRKKGGFSNVAFEGTYNMPTITYKYFSGYKNDTELLRAMFNLTFQNSSSSTLSLEPHRTYDVEYPKLPYAHAIFEYYSVSNKAIHGNGSLINDKRSRSQMSYTSYDGVFLLNDCHGIAIRDLDYQNLNEEYVELADENGSVKYKAGIENQIGYVGSSFILLYNDCSDIHISANITGARYGIKSGDYSMFWLCGDYGVKNSTFDIHAKRTGYPVAIEVGDSLGINVVSDTHHRACYLCGISNSNIKVRAKNIMIAPIHCLLSDTHYSKGDKTKPQFKACYNLNIDFCEMGSDIVESSDAYCVSFQTYNNSPFLSRTEPLIWHDINVNIRKEQPVPKVGLFCVSRNYANNESEPLSIQDTFKNISIIATDPFESSQWAVRVRTSDVALYDNIQFKVEAPNANVICDNANAYSFDFSVSKFAGLYYSGKVTVNRNNIERIVENKTSMKAKGHQLTNK